MLVSDSGEVKCYALSVEVMKLNGEMVNLVIGYA